MAPKKTKKSSKTGASSGASVTSNDDVSSVDDLDLTVTSRLSKREALLESRQNMRLDPTHPQSASTLDVALSAERLMVRGMDMSNHASLPMQASSFGGGSHPDVALSSSSLPSSTVVDDSPPNASSALRHLSYAVGAATYAPSQPSPSPLLPPAHSSLWHGHPDRIPADEYHRYVGNLVPGINLAAASPSDAPPLVPASAAALSQQQQQQQQHQQHQLQPQPPPSQFVGGGGGGGGVMSATGPQSGFASSTECLHLTLTLRRCLTELESRGNRVHELLIANAAEVARRQEAEAKAKVELAKVEERERSVADVEKRAAICARQLEQELATSNRDKESLSRKFQALLDWSREEESYRLDLQEECKALSLKVRELETVILNAEDGRRREAGKTARLQKQHDDLNAKLSNCAALLAESGRTEANATAMANSARGESAALKTLAARLEGEVEQARARLKGADSEREREAQERNEELRALKAENARLNGLIVGGVGAAQIGGDRGAIVYGGGKGLEGWKREALDLERRLAIAIADKERGDRLLADSEAKRLATSASERTGTERCRALEEENRALKADNWELGARVRDLESSLRLRSEELGALEARNADLNSLLDRVEDEKAMRSATLAGRVEHSLSPQHDEARHSASWGRGVPHFSSASPFSPYGTARQQSTLLKYAPKPPGE